MRISKANAFLTITFLLALILSACGSQTAVQPTEEPVMEATTVPTVVPTAGPEVVEPSDGVKIILYEIPEGVTLDAKMDPDLKSNTPPTKNFDRVYTDPVIITITQDGASVVLDKGAVELCFKFTEPTSVLGPPIPYYWDTFKTPMVDGRVSEILSRNKTSICTPVLNSGAYAVVVY